QPKLSCDNPTLDILQNHHLAGALASYAKHEIVSWKQKKIEKRTAAGIPTWSPTVVLICRSTAYVWQSGRDAQFSADCGR
ncbi:hypothetical protein KCU77_g20134, partial [Aureobasidium melanogenum]